MSISPEVNAKTLTALVGRQIRHAMVDADVLQSELARRMGKTEQWVSVRLRGRQAIDLNDLLLFARALGVEIHDLMPPREAITGVMAPPNERSADLPPRPTRRRRADEPRRARLVFGSPDREPQGPFGHTRAGTSRPASGTPASSRRPKAGRPANRTRAA